MKKLILLFSFCVFIFGSQAQISLNTTDVAPVNIVVYNATDTIVNPSLVGFAGASQTWNMTSLNEDTNDTLIFYPYSAAPEPKLSSANLLIKQGYLDSYIYLNNSASSLTVVGSTGVIGTAPIVQTITPAEKIMNFPANFNNTFTSNYQTDAKFYYGMSGVDSVRTKSIVKKTVLIDAWGNLTTPFGTYPVLRFKETKISIDTTDAYLGTPYFTWLNFAASKDSTTTYTWWAKTIGYPLASATMDSTGAVSKMEWLKAIAVGIDENIAAKGINVFPNPAQNEITFVIETPNAESIQIADISGRIINTTSVNGDLSQINTSSFANGIYTYSIIGEDHVILHQGKFTVAK